MKKLIALFLFSPLIMTMVGCEKLSNSAKNLESDFLGLDREIEVYGCLNGKSIRTYEGDVRYNEEDGSILLDGHKLNLSPTACWIMQEQGIKPTSVHGKSYTSHDK